MIYMAQPDKVLFMSDVAFKTHAFETPVVFRLYIISSNSQDLAIGKRNVYTVFRASCNVVSRHSDLYNMGSARNFFKKQVSTQITETRKNE